MVLSARVAACVALDDILCEPNMCLQTVRQWFQIGAKHPDAATAWRHASPKHPGDRHPPRGAVAYWTGGSHGDGHCALTLGDGHIRSPDSGGPGRIATVSLSWPEREWGLHYAGWSWCLNGVTIPHPPRVSP